MLSNGFIHCQNVFHRGVGLDIMDRSEHEPSPPTQNLDALTNLSANVIRRPKGKRALGIHATPPKT